MVHTRKKRKRDEEKNRCVDEAQDVVYIPRRAPHPLGQYHHLILRPQEQDHFLPLHLKENDIANYERRDWQIAASKAVRTALLNNTSSGCAALVAKGKSGKTIIAGQTVRLLVSDFQERQQYRGKTLGIYLNYNATEIKQGPKVGCSMQGLFNPTAQHIYNLKKELDRNGAAVVMMHRRGFVNTLQGKPGSDYSFRDLTMEDFNNRGKKLNDIISGAFQEGTAPALLSMVHDLNIRNVVVIVDEFHGALSQTDGNMVRLLANYKQLSRLSLEEEWVPPLCGSEFNFHVIGLSATPGTKSTVSCSATRFDINRLCFYTLSPVPQEESRPTTGTLLAAMAASTVDYTAASVHSSMAAMWWANYDPGVEHNSSADHNRKLFLESPTSPTILHTAARLVVMNAVTPCKTSEDDFQEVSKTYVFPSENGESSKVSYVSCASRVKKKENVTALSPTINDNHVKYLANDVDSSTFLNGRTKAQSLDDMNVHNPKKVAMRVVDRIVRIDGRCHALFKRIDHYHCVLLGVDVASCANMSLSRAAAANLNSMPKGKTVVFDFVGKSHAQMEMEMMNDVKKRIEENRLLVVILVRASDVHGIEWFGPYVTSCIYIGDNRDNRIQLFNRVLRLTAPVLGMILPLHNVGYLNYSLASNFGVNLVNDNHNSLDSIMNMEEGCPARAAYEYLNERESTVAHRFARHLFKLKSKSQAAVPIEYEVEGLEWVDCVGAPPQGLIETFMRLYKERKKNSETWTDAFQSHLKSIMQLRERVIDEDDN